MEDVFFPERAVSFHTSLGLYGYLREDVGGRSSKAFLLLSLGEPMSSFLMKWKFSAAWRSKDGTIRSTSSLDLISL